MNIILGSHSPRRRELLEGLDISFQTVDIDCDETYPADLKAGDIPLFLARRKAEAYSELLGADDLLITADTIVWHEGKMLGKPQDLDEARQMLRSLSGKTHQVYTGVCLTTPADQRSFVCKTDVEFDWLTDRQIDYYVDNYRPLDKAGAYGIQEWIGYVGVKAIHGSYFNVMGLPIQRLAKTIEEMR